MDFFQLIFLWKMKCILCVAVWDAKVLSCRDDICWLSHVWKNTTTLHCHFQFQLRWSRWQIHASTIYYQKQKRGTRLYDTQKTSITWYLPMPLYVYNIWGHTRAAYQKFGFKPHMQVFLFQFVSYFTCSDEEILRIFIVKQFKIFVCGTLSFFTCSDHDSLFCLQDTKKLWLLCVEHYSRRSDYFQHFLCQCTKYIPT